MTASEFPDESPQSMVGVTVTTLSTVHYHTGGPDCCPELHSLLTGDHQVQGLTYFPTSISQVVCPTTIPSYDGLQG